MNIKQDLRDRLITGTFAIGQGYKEPTNWKTYAEDLELEYEKLAVENQSLLINARRQSPPSLQEREKEGWKVLANTPRNSLIEDYIQEYAWNYGRFWHTGSYERIIGNISERMVLPNEYLTEIKTKLEGLIAVVELTENKVGLNTIKEIYSLFSYPPNESEDTAKQSK